MRRAGGLIVHELSRREFCAFACAAVVAACNDGDSRAIQTGNLDFEGMPVDAPPGDAGVDGMTGGACSSTYVDVGAASSFVLNKPTYIAGTNIFIMRDANGLYAVTARCPHQGVTIMDTGVQFHCQQHGADFTYNGAVIDGPTNKPLVHYAMCTLPGGHVGVEKQTIVSASARLVA